MKKLLIFIAIGVAFIIILAAVVNVIQHNQTKSYSPEDIATLSHNDLKVSVFYNRPYKKDREIFGSLVPYGKVWRTGANEATIFETNKPLTIEGKMLSPGRYSLWTIPDSVAWMVIFNSETGQWGINSKAEANRNPQLDVLTISAQAITQEREVEQFTIKLNYMGEEAEMVLLWDKTVVVVPFSF